MQHTVNLQNLIQLIVENHEDIRMNMSVTGKVLFHIELDPQEFEQATGCSLRGQ